MGGGVALAIAAALLYGVSDFFGGVGARRLRVLPSTTIAYAFAAVALLIAWPFDAGTITPGALIAGSFAGVFAIVGFLAFYAAMAIGPMSLLSPLAAVLQSLIPVVVALVIGDRLTLPIVAGIVLALVAAGLISVQRGPGATRVRARGLVMGLVAGVALGLSVAALDFAPAGSGLLPGVVEIVLGLVIVTFIRVLLRSGEPEDTTMSLPRARLVSAVGGVLLGAGNAFLVLALGTGSLAVVSVVVGLYPVGTVVLAAFVLHERVTRVQIAGVVLAIAASVVFALA